MIVVRRFSSASRLHTNGYIYTSTHDGGWPHIINFNPNAKPLHVGATSTRARAHIHFRLTLLRAGRASGSAPLARFRDLLRCVSTNGQTGRPSLVNIGEYTCLCRPMKSSCTRIVLANASLNAITPPLYMHGNNNETMLRKVQSPKQLYS